MSFLPKVKGGKLDLKPKRHHGFQVVLFIFGTIFPPLAVAARFGIGSDFWLNLLLTICGYIPGHVHNFYIQNIRNNQNRRRTPKWAIRYGLVDDSEIKRKERKSQWANRYNERNPHSALEGQPYEEGQEPSRSEGSLASTAPGPSAARAGGEHLWNESEEQFYNPTPPNGSAAGGRWKYPANFDDTEPESPVKRKKTKKDRWALSEDARHGVFDESLQPKRRKKKRASSSRHNAADDEVVRPPMPPSEDSSVVIPEDPTGEHYGQQQRTNAQDDANRADEELFNHQF